MTKPSYAPRFSQTARAICIRSSAVMSVESRCIRSSTSTPHTPESSGSSRSSPSPSSTGVRPCPVSRQAIVPPVAISRIFPAEFTLFPMNFSLLPLEFPVHFSFFPYFLCDKSRKRLISPLTFGIFFLVLDFPFFSSFFPVSLYFLCSFVHLYARSRTVSAF